jgi:hypothetical protein
MSKSVGFYRVFLGGASIGASRGHEHARYSGPWGKGGEKCLSLVGDPFTWPNRAALSSAVVAGFEIASPGIDAGSALRLPAWRF